jgi:hypothetical protein
MDMDITYYTFAFFVFILLCVLIWLFGRVTREKKKESTGSFEKEQRLFRLYQNIEDMMGSFEEYAESVKKEINEGLDSVKAMLEEKKSAPAEPEKQPEDEAKNPERIIIKPIDEPKLKTEERIMRLAQKGMDKGEIAKELGLSIREVSLIMDIKKITIPDA